MNNEQTVAISMWLQPSQPRLNFCMICRENMHFQVEGYPKTVLVGVDASQRQEDGYRPLQSPLRVRCTGKSMRYGRCPALYIIQGYIDE